MSLDDDARIMRERLADLEAELARLAESPDQSAAILGQTYTRVTYPTAAQRFYDLYLVEIGGTEVEGATPTLSATSLPFQALNLGTVIPPSGTNVICVQARGYWVFRYG